SGYGWKPRASFVPGNNESVVDKISFQYTHPATVLHGDVGYGRCYQIIRLHPIGAPVLSARTTLPILGTLSASVIPVASPTLNIREFEFLYPAETVCIPSVYPLKLQVFDKKKRDASAAMKSLTPYQVAIVEATVYPLTSTAISNAYVTTYFNGIAQKITSYTD